MSASLVGSEMCIRDRATRSGSLQPRGAGASSHATRSGRGRAGQGRPGQACLLYTSDAADDM
eukprot:3667288-Alexandrium_andersonii.AAC.1